MMTDKEKILKLLHGECYTFPESDYGKAEVWRIWENYILFSIPTFGGTPTFNGSYRTSCIDNLLSEVDSWT